MAFHARNHLKKKVLCGYMSSIRSEFFMYDFCAFLTALDLEKIGQKKLVYTVLLMYLTILLLSISVP